MMPAPVHLRKCTVPVKAKCGETTYFAKVRCPCGGRDFEILHTGWLSDYRGDLIPMVSEFQGRTVFIVKAKCVACEKAHLLFDQERHGWNGYVCRPQKAARSAKKPPMTSWTCKKCSGLPHSITVQVIGEDMETAIEESDGILTRRNWQEGFGALNLSNQCSTCGHKPKVWIQAETM